MFETVKEGNITKRRTKKPVIPHDDEQAKEEVMCHIFYKLL